MLAGLALFGRHARDISAGLRRRWPVRLAGLLKAFVLLTGMRLRRAACLVSSRLCLRSRLRLLGRRPWLLVLDGLPRGAEALAVVMHFPGRVRELATRIE